MIWAYFSIRQSVYWSLQEQKIIIHLFAYSGVQHIVCCVFDLFFVFFCVPYVACFIGLSILDCPLRILLRSFILHRSGEQGLVCCFVGLVVVQVLLILFFLSVDTAVILTFVLGLNCCRSRLTTRKSLLTPAFVRPGFVLKSQIYPDFGVRLKRFCNNITNLTRLRRSSHNVLYIQKGQSKNDNPEKLAT